jgi:hypothetical protein
MILSPVVQNNQTLFLLVLAPVSIPRGLPLTFDDLLSHFTFKT